jgi:uncharacterized protein
MAEPPLCAFCRKHPIDSKWHPFCSQRCQLQDLARWADGTYRVPDETTANPDQSDTTGDE